MSTYRIEHMEPERVVTRHTSVVRVTEPIVTPGDDRVLVVNHTRTPICRCWDVREAERIRDALNAAEGKR